MDFNRKIISGKLLNIVDGGGEFLSIYGTGGGGGEDSVLYIGDRSCRVFLIPREHVKGGGEMVDILP
jgi:hypothetical protein